MAFVKLTVPITCRIGDTIYHFRPGEMIEPDWYEGAAEAIKKAEAELKAQQKSPKDKMIRTSRIK